jgi:hypothetical protein
MRKWMKHKAKVYKQNPANVRKARTAEYLRNLGESVIQGQKTPLIVAPDMTILDGNGMHAGVMMIDPEFELECIMTDEEINSLDIQVITSIKKQKLQPFELYSAIGQEEEKNPQSKLCELAARWGVTQGWLTQLRSLKDCIPPIYEAAEAGLIGPKDWYPLSQVDAAEQHRLWELRRNGTKREEIVRETRKRKNAQASAVKVQKVRIVLPGAAVILSGKALDMSAVVELLEDCLKQAKRAAETYDVKTWMRMMANQAAGS